MASNSIIEVRIGAPGNVLEVEVGTVEVDVLRSVGYYGGLAVAVGIGLIEPPLALFIAAVSVFKVLTNTVPVRDWPPVNITHVAFRLMVGAGAAAGGRAELVERGHVDLVKPAPARPAVPGGFSIDDSLSMMSTAPSPAPSASPAASAAKAGRRSERRAAAARCVGAAPPASPEESSGSAHTMRAAAGSPP